MHPSRVRPLVLGALGALLAACNTSPWRVQAPPWSQETVDGAEQVRVELHSGEVLALAVPTIRATGDVGWLHGREGGRDRSVALREVKQLETCRDESFSWAGAAVTGIQLLALCALFPV